MESMEEVAKNCDTEKFFDDSDGATSAALTDIHKFECTFYHEIAKILDVPVPKVYKTVEWIMGKKDGCIHMEDLTLRGKTINFFDNINLTQVKCFIRHLAHWHKNILTADPKTWRGKHFPSNMEAFKSVLATFDKMAMDFMETSSLKREFFFTGVREERNRNGYRIHAVQLSTHSPLKLHIFADLFEPLITKYHTFANSFEYMKWAGMESYKEQGIPSVIVHGDMHSGNIMWAIDENGDIQNEIAAFVDWQVIRIRHC